MPLINSLKEFFNNLNKDRDIELVIQKWIYFIQIYYETMVDSIKKCIFHDFIDDFKSISLFL